MSSPQDSTAGEDSGWPSNYFNYFTEIEEHFQRARGTSLFLLSPLDWAVIENWKNGGVPLEAVLRGIDEAFDKWRSRKVKTRRVNSIAYCTQAVMEAAQSIIGRRRHSSPRSRRIAIPRKRNPQAPGGRRGSCRHGKSRSLRANCRFTAGPCYRCRETRE